MSRLAKKFMLRILLILSGVTFLSIYINSNFISRYYFYQEKKDLERISDEVILGKGRLEETITELEAREDVIIARIQGSDDNNLLNERLRTAFLSKGISLKKYWLWKEDQLAAYEKGRKLRIYRQEKLRYSLMIEYLRLDNVFLAVAKIIPSANQTISLVNQVTAVVFLAAAFLILFFIFLLTKKITSPLAVIGSAARSIAGLDFKTVDIKTGDELEELAEDINNMSRSLKEAKEALEQKNRQMETLLANVSHDLKTPVSLIKAYANGIQDGLDDGSFLTTILEQNHKMERMIERLLTLARMKRHTTEALTEPFSLSRLLEEQLTEYLFQMERSGLPLVKQIEPDITLTGNREAVSAIIYNLISNAVKYAPKGPITVSLSEQEQTPVFIIRNPVLNQETIPLDRIWEPFFVGEASRNQSMSGTGLGLSIVKAAAEQYGYRCQCEFKGSEIQFTLHFCPSPDSGS